MHKGIAIIKDNNPCVNFCKKIVLKGIFTLEIKFKLCKITLIPPKPIKPLAKIIFVKSETELEDKPKIPLVISMPPHKTNCTTSLYLLQLNTLHIVLDKNSIICKLFNTEIIKKLKAMYAPTIKMEIKLS